jgi:PPK2 family polyphosphate:nucleotide phosphotransferase
MKAKSDLSSWVEKYMVRAGAGVDLAKHYSSDDKSAFDGDKEAGKKQLKAVNERLSELHGMLYAEGKHNLLIILQAMDTGGKDGTIKNAFEGFDPIGVRVVSYKKPTEEELSHDYLWRVHKNVPAKGEVAIFNRSHYEDVLVVAVHNYVAPEVWNKRYQHINDFERMLTDEGTTILKFFLNISKDEQKQRLEERIADPSKRWKFKKDDLKERKFWDDYMRAYETAISKTSTDYAPWFIIPGNSNWYRNLAVSSITAATLEGLKMKYPEGEPGIEKVVVK